LEVTASTGGYVPFGAQRSFSSEEGEALVTRKKAYGVLTVRDPRDGSIRALWFDISGFFPEF
jgi:hypothetical protein